MGKIYNFDKGVHRRGSDARKFDPSLCPSDVLPFWIADTEFMSPVEVKEAIIKRAELGHFGYPYINEDFEKSVAYWYKVRHNAKIDPELVNFSPFVIPGMIWFIKEFSNVGDKILIQTPVYPPFHTMVKNNGRQLVCNKMILKKGHYEIDFCDLEKKLSDPAVKILFICNPQNPTGRCFTKEELTKMGNLCLKYNVMVGVDEIHADIVYDNREFVCFSEINEDFGNISVTFLNPAKTFNVAGFGTAAWFTHNKNIYDRMFNQQSYASGMGRTILGHTALVTCYTKGEDYANQLVKYLNETRDEVIDFFKKNIPSIKVIKPEATYMAWLDCRKLGFKTQKEYNDFFKEEAKVLLNDGSTFGKTEGFGFMRFNFASQRSIVREGMNRIKDAVERHFNK